MKINQLKVGDIISFDSYRVEGIEYDGVYIKHMESGGAHPFYIDATAIKEKDVKLVRSANKFINSLIK